MEVDSRGRFDNGGRFRETLFFTCRMVFKTLFSIFFVSYFFLIKIYILILPIVCF